MSGHAMETGARIQKRGVQKRFERLGRLYRLEDQ